jgi:hypothetical protein
VPWTEPPVYRGRRGRLFGDRADARAGAAHFPPTFSQPINLSRSFYYDRRPDSLVFMGLLPIEWVIFRNLDVMAVFDDDTLADR